MMPKTSPAPDPELARFYEKAEQEYLRSLPPEHFMEAFAQGKQREITLESFALIRETRPEVQCFNELLVQYPRGKRKKLGQVVPDNMIVVHPEPIQVRGSFNAPLQPADPFVVLEYVSKYNKRKDYEDNHAKYERELKVPYYVLFYPDNEELSVFRMSVGKYVTVTPNAASRLPIPELELEVALLDGWVRFWFRNELLPLPGDLMRRLTATQDQLTTTQDQLATERAARSAVEAELARVREELARSKGQS